MDLDAILKAGEDPDALREAVSALVQAEVRKNVESLSAERDAAREEARRREAKTEELLDELKPLRRLLSDHGVNGTEGLRQALGGLAPSIGEKLPTQDELKAAVEKAREEATQSAATSFAERERTLEEELEAAKRSAEASLAARNRARLEADVYRAEAEGAPKAGSRRLRGLLLDHLANFVRYEDGEDGSPKAIAKDGDMPILYPKTGKPATIGELLTMAAESRGAGSWDRDTDDFFLSAGAGGGAGEGGPGRGAPSLDTLAATTTLDGYVKERQRMSA